MNAAERADLLRARFKPNLIKRPKTGVGLARMQNPNAPDVWPKRARGYVIFPKSRGDGFVSLGRLTVDNYAVNQKWVKTHDKKTVTMFKQKRRCGDSSLTKVARKSLAKPKRVLLPGILPPK